MQMLHFKCKNQHLTVVEKLLYFVEGSLPALAVWC